MTSPSECHMAQKLVIVKLSVPPVLPFPVSKNGCVGAHLEAERLTPERRFSHEVGASG